MTIQAAAIELKPELASRARGIEQARRLPADLAADMARSGFFRMLTPAAYGGLQMPPEEFSQVLQTLAAGDASAAWCAMVAGTSALTAAYLPQDVAQTIFADPELIIGGVFAPFGKAEIQGEHYRLSGRWQWASGSQNCDWLCAGAMLFANGELKRDANGAPEQRMLLFPREQADLIDTWHVAGLQGTGSGDMAVADLKVLQTHSVSLISDAPADPGALYVFPVFGLLALGIASVALGNARASLDALQALAASKKPGGGRRTLAERGVTQSEFAQASARWSGAQAYLQQTVAANWQAAQTHGNLSLEQRAELRLACTHATRTSAGVTRICCDLAGGAAVFLDNELQRRFRDAQVACAHVMVAPPTYELAGRVALGVETDTSQL